MSPGKITTYWAANGFARWRSLFTFGEIPDMPGVLRASKALGAALPLFLLSFFTTPTGSAFPSPRTEEDCSIESIELTSFADCTPASDQISAILRIEHSNAPGSGSLVVNGLMFPISESPQEAWLPLDRNGETVTVEAYFSAAPECRLTLTDLFAVPDGACPVCEIASVALVEAPECLEAGETGEAIFRISYENPPDDGKLVVNGRRFPIKGSPQRVKLPVKAGDAARDLSVSFSKNSDCTLYSIKAVPEIGICPPSRESRCREAEVIEVDMTGKCQSLYSFAFPDLAPLSDWGASCAPYNGDEVWLKFEVPETGEVRLTARPDFGDTRLAIQLFQGCSAVGLDCAYQISSKNSIELLIQDLTPGDTALVAVWPAEGPTTGMVELCLAIPTPPPANDLCSRARPLPLNDPLLGQGCEESVRVDWKGALRNGGIGPCLPMTGGDVWYYVVAPKEGSILIRAIGENAPFTAMAAYDDCDGRLLGCTGASNTQKPELLLQKLEPGQRVLIQTYPLVSGVISNVELCAMIPPKKASNDICAEARFLAPQSSGSCADPEVISNIEFSASGVVSSCAGQKVKDLWYKTVVPRSGVLTIEISKILGIVSPSIALYADCGNTLIACGETEDGNGSLEVSDLPPGDTLTFAVWDALDFKFGSAALCVYGPPAPANDQCMNSAPLEVGLDSLADAIIVDGFLRATADEGLFSCSDQPVYALWYDIVSPESGLAVAKIAGTDNFQGGIAAFDGCDGTLLGCTTNSGTEKRLILTDLPAGQLIKLATWGSIDTLSLLIWEPICPAMLVDIFVDPPDCFGASNGRAELTAAEDPDAYQFIWSTGHTTPAVDSLIAGNYRVIITDPYGCRDSLLLTVDQPKPLSAHVKNSSPDGTPITDAFQVIANGGTPPYTYRLDEQEPQTDSYFQDLDPGNYLVIVTDAQGCTWSETVAVEGVNSTVPPRSVDAFSLFPNPAGKAVSMELELKQALPVQVEIWNSAGSRIFVRRLDRAAVHLENWDLSNLAAGLYLIRLEIQGDWFSHRFLKVN